VRLLLDANLSGRRVGRLLERRGHDVLALSDDDSLGRLTDEEVLQLAAAERRILVTRNSRDFAPILREWAERGQPHAGCILIWTLGHRQFAQIANAIDRLVGERPTQREWRDLTLAV
jgi:predicted nuclease of predicted toxin-antitoxin system